MIYKGRDTFIDIGKAKDNFDKDRRPKCFNCNAYRHMAKDCKKPKKEQNTRNFINIRTQDILLRIVDQGKR